MLLRVVVMMRRRSRGRSERRRREEEEEEGEGDMIISNKDTTTMIFFCINRQWTDPIVTVSGWRHKATKQTRRLSCNVHGLSCVRRTRVILDLVYKKKSPGMTLCG